ncbi:MAG: hypothetical protein V3T86_05910 [Planctomycetota bacterium]
MLRVVLLAAAVAVGFVGGLLYGERQGASRIAERPPAKFGPDITLPKKLPDTPKNGETPVEIRVTVPLPDVEYAARTRPNAPRTQKELAAFVYACAARGKEAVPLLQSLLDSGRDARIRKVWKFSPDGEMDGYASLRAAYLEALRSIAGEDAAQALEQAYRGASTEESYLIALALSERGRYGWAGTLLDRADKSGAPAEAMHLLPKMVALAAGAEPGETAARLEANAPRGASTSDPRVMATALAHMPLQNALATADRLLADPDITLRAKTRYLNSLLTGRAELEAIRTVRVAIERAGTSEALRAAAVNDAVKSRGFLNDKLAYQHARAKGNNAAAQAARERFDRRAEEVRALIVSAYGPGSTNRRAEVALQRLKRLGEELDR